MTKTATIHTRIEPLLKIKAEKILAKLGLSASEAIGMFYSQITLRKGLPFEARVPNKTTRKAMEDMRAGRNTKSFRTVEELFADLEN